MAELDRDPVVLVTPDPGRVRTAVRDPVGHDVGELLPVGLLVAACDPAHVRLRVRLRALLQALIDAEVGAFLVAPGQLLLDPGPAELAHSARARLVVHQVDDGLGVLVHVVGLDVNRRRRRGHPRLPQVESDHRQPEAMYSIVLFIVDTSLSGFFGSGDRPTSAVDRMRATSSSGARPVNST